MKGIFVESLRGAIIIILRLIIYVIIIVLIVYIIGLFNKDKPIKRGGINASQIMEKL